MKILSNLHNKLTFETLDSLKNEKATWSKNTTEKATLSYEERKVELLFKLLSGALGNDRKTHAFNVLKISEKEIYSLAKTTTSEKCKLCKDILFNDLSSITQAAWKS